MKPPNTAAPSVQNKPAKIMEDNLPKEFTAIVAAAGKSRRYGSPKLLELLPGTGVSVIEHLVQQLFRGGASRVIVVLGPPGQQPYDQIAQLAASAGGTAIQIDPHPAEMIDSVKAGLSHYLKHFQPEAGSACYILMTPADLPGISPEYVRKLLSECRLRTESLIRGQTLAGRGVHPVAIRQELIGKILQSPMPDGLKALWSDSLIERHEFLWEEPDVAHDLDFPHDWKNFTENG